ncbi:MAG: hypothetical protein IPK26_00465 [Planctomycetes bacterium]|nr:hypothetical protein [Planctomycetota bacterium]
MSLLYRVFSVAAGLGAWSRRIFIWFLPLNWILLVLLIAGTFGAAREARYAWQNDAEATPMSIGEVLGKPELEGRFVRVAGTLIPTAVFEVSRSSRRSGRTTVEASYLPLISRNDGKAILVERSGIWSTMRDPVETTVTGMLVPIDSKVLTELQKTGGKVQDLPFDLELMIEDGRHPWPLAGALGATIACALLVFGMLLGMLRRNVIFQSAASAFEAAKATSKPDPAREIRVTASGPFDLIGQPTMQLVNQPVAIARLSTGRIGFIAGRVDDSAESGSAANLLAITVEPADLAEPEPGWYYHGFARSPALRIAHLDARGRARETVLACPTVSDTVALAELLVTLSRTPVPAVPAASGRGNDSAMA